jgi:hypothetical protein
LFLEMGLHGFDGEGCSQVASSGAYPL